MWHVLDEMYLIALSNLMLITGGAPGADTIAQEWARCTGCTNEVYPADWATYGKRAGFIRNKRMLEEGKPSFVLAFRMEGESRGTDMMVKIAEAAGVHARVIPWRIGQQ